MSRRLRLPSSAGFTLVELMVVVAIIGILATIALISVDPDKKARTTRGFADSVASRLDLVRQRAVTTQRVQMVRVASDNLDHYQAPEAGMLADYEVADIDGAGTWEPIHRLTAPRGIAIVSFDIKAHLVDNVDVPADGANLPATLYFRPDGTVVAPIGGYSSATFFIGNDSRDQTFRVLLFRVTGSVQVLKSW